MSNLDTLLENLAKARSSIESAMADKRKRGELFNVFELCGVNHYETMHSSILAEFLSPSGLHGMGDYLLQQFAKCFVIGEYSNNAEVKTELSEKIGGQSIGRFDILIQDASTGHICIIENKIHAGEQPEQLRRYGRWLDKKAKESCNGKRWTVHLVFLTLDGHESETAEENRKYVAIPYLSPKKQNEVGEDVIGWLKRCADCERMKPTVRNALLQYSDHIKNIATGEREMSEQICKVLQKGSMKSAQDAYENFERACIDAADKILVDDVKKSLPSGWKVYKGCSWKRKEQGVLYVPPEGPSLKGQIYVIFDQTQLYGCEIVLFQEKKDESLPILIKKKEITNWEKRGWNVDCEKWSEYPLWRPVRCGMKRSDNQNAFEYGTNWDGLFFDRYYNDEKFRKDVVDEIVQGIHELYEIQKALS